ncbi:hypothetical protein GCM10009646_79590 [Streptomyces aureus]
MDLVVSELVTNAHAPRRGGRCTWELTAHPDTIEVAVHDPSRHAQAHPDLNGGTTAVERARRSTMGQPKLRHSPCLRR